LHRIASRMGATGLSISPFFPSFCILLSRRDPAHRLQSSHAASQVRTLVQFDEREGSCGAFF
jgi:hypothetical protein